MTEDASDLCDHPKGDLILRTMAMPADTNANGDIFGGWIMSQMDIAGGILAKEINNLSQDKRRCARASLRVVKSGA